MTFTHLSRPSASTARATTETHPLTLHDALPISQTLAAADPPVGVDDDLHRLVVDLPAQQVSARHRRHVLPALDRKSTRLNSSHLIISYAAFCFKQTRPTHPNT